jgi:glycerate kinase
VLASERLRERALSGSLTFEIATRARQGGVPSFAVTADSQLDAFDARILDLQAIIEARTARELTSAGYELTSLAWPHA